MLIGGFKKIYPADSNENPCLVIFTQGCDFRCKFCDSKSLMEINEGEASENEVLKYLLENKNEIKRVEITGGEPTLHYDLKRFVGAIKNMGFWVSLQTSGLNCDSIKELLDEKLLDYIAMDIKNCWENYPLISKLDEFLHVNRCKKSLEAIQESGIDHEFRTTYLPEVHTIEDFRKIASYLKDGETYVIQHIRRKDDFNQIQDENASMLAQKLKKEFPLLDIREKI